MEVGSPGRRDWRLGILGGGLWEEDLEAESPGDWSLGGGVGSREERLEAGSLGIRRGKIGGSESWEEGLEAGREEGLEWEWIGGWESWDERLEAGNPGRRDWRLGGGRIGG